MSDGVSPEGAGLLPTVEPVPVSPLCAAIPDADEGFYDDAGRWWPSNAEWCDRCQGMGTEECLCAGDFCCCGWGDNRECSRCHGEGYYILTDKMKAEREEIAKWWHGVWESASRDSDGNPEGGDGTAPSRSDDSAGPEAIAQDQSAPKDTAHDQS